jgi:hypothetical protein
VDASVSPILPVKAVHASKTKWSRPNGPQCICHVGVHVWVVFVVDAFVSLTLPSQAAYASTKCTCRVGGYVGAGVGREVLFRIGVGCCDYEKGFQSYTHVHPRTPVHAQRVW